MANTNANIWQDTIRGFHRALVVATTPRTAIYEAVQFYKTMPAIPDPGTPLGDAMTRILRAHRDRIKAGGSAEACEAAMTGELAALAGESS